MRNRRYFPLDCMVPFIPPLEVFTYVGNYLVMGKVGAVRFGYSHKGRQIIKHIHCRKQRQYNRKLCREERGEGK